MVKKKQRGKGLVDTAVQNVGKVLTGTDIKYKGERHAVMMTEAGLKRANFNGPGTNLFARLKNGDKPISEVDTIAKAHDLRYGLALVEDDVRKADQLMLNSLNKSKDYQVNILPAKAGINAKILLEDKVGVPKSFFTTFGEKDPGIRSIYTNELKKLEQQGYGRIKRTKKNRKLK